MVWLAGLFGLGLGCLICGGWFVVWQRRVNLSLVKQAVRIPAGLPDTQPHLQELLTAQQEIQHLRTKLADDQTRRNALTRAETQLAHLQLALAGDEQRRQRLLKAEAKLVHLQTALKRSDWLEQELTEARYELGELTKCFEQAQAEITFLEAKMTRSIGEPSFTFTSDMRIETGLRRDDEAIWLPTLH